MKQITFLTGRNSDCLSYEILNRIKNLAQNKKHVILIVPAQYTLTAENIYAEKLGETLLAKIKITTLPRMAKKFFDQNGSNLKFIGKAGKTSLITKACTEANHLLNSFKDCRHINFIEELSETISDLKNFKISPEVFAEAVKENPRLSEISLIYSAYDALMGASFADNDDLLPLFSEMIAESNLYTDTFVFADYFKYMSIAEASVFQSLCLGGAELTIALEIPDITDRDDIFSPPRRIYNIFRSFASDHGINTDISICETSTIKNPTSFSFIAQNLYADTIKTCDDHNGICLYRATDPEDEIDFIACEISRLVRDEGFRYEDFAVITRKPETYASVFDAVFSQYDIPVFRHKKGDVTQKPASRFLHLLFSAITDGYSTETILDLLHCGFFDIDDAKAAAFEKYVNVWGIRYGDFEKPFTRNINGLKAKEDMSDADKEALEYAEETRKKILALTEEFKNETENATAEKISLCIYNIFQKTEMQKHLEKIGENYKRCGEETLYSENTQTYNILISVIDEISSVYGGEYISASEYGDILDLALDSEEISIIPTSIDEVLSGDAASAPLTTRKCVFIYGLCDGMFPADINDRALLSYADKELLNEKGIHAGLSADDEILYEEFLAYSAITCATEKLYLSYPNIFNGEKKPSSAFTQIKKMFPKLMILTTPNKEINGAADMRIQKLRPAFGFYTRMNASNMKNVFENTVFEKFLSKAEKQEHLLSPETAAKLFGTKMNITPSRSETYFSCPYSYFLKYGLRITEDTLAKFNPLNTGTFLHDLLENIIGKPGWLEQNEDEIKREAIQHTQKFFKNIFGEESLPASLENYARILLNKILRLINIFRREFMQSCFKPVGFEFEISDKGDIQPVCIEISGGEIIIGGKVDRIDAYISNDKTYLRIIDYKSSDKKLCFSDIYSGTNIQLLCYLYALRENGTVKFTNPLPAGVEYINIKPKTKELNLKNTKKDCAENFEDNALFPVIEEGNLETEGLFLSDINVLSAMEKEFEGKYIPVKKNILNAGNMNLNGAENLINTEQFEEIFAHIKRIFCIMGESLLKGEINKKPVSELNSPINKPCRYCMIRDVCEEKAETCYPQKLAKKDFFELTGEEKPSHEMD